VSIENDKNDKNAQNITEQISSETIETVDKKEPDIDQIMDDITFTKGFEDIIEKDVI